MEYRNIPGTDLSVSLLGFGNFMFGTNWWGEFTDEQGIRLQNRAFDLGVNFFDTAPAYGNGRAERLLARTIEYAGRDKLVVSTKFGYDFYSDPGQEGGHRERRQDFSGAFVRDDLERSLQRLQIDCIDLYQAHNLKIPQFQDHLFQTLEDLIVAGKIRYAAVALGPAIGWREEGYQALIERDAATVQTVFNLYEQDPGRELCQICAQRGRGGIIARVPTNSGILDDEFSTADHQFPPWDHRKFRDRNWLIYGLKKNDIVRGFAQTHGLSLPQLAFKWLAAQRGLVSIEPNLLTEKDVIEFCQATAGAALDTDTLTELHNLYKSDFNLGDDAHPCDLKSSINESGAIRSAYQKPMLERVQPGTSHTS